MNPNRCDYLYFKPKTEWSGDFDNYFYILIRSISQGHGKYSECGRRGIRVQRCFQTSCPKKKRLLGTDVFTLMFYSLMAVVHKRDHIDAYVLNA